VKASAVTDETARKALDALSDRYALDVDQRRRLLGLLQTVASEHRAPTTIRDPAAIVDLHLADSLVGLEVEQLRSAASIADLGSGAGFPGLPLAIALPGAHVDLVESQVRKRDFLAAAIAASEIENAAIVGARAEGWSEGLHSQDAVVARALAPPPVVAEYAAPLLRLGGALVDWRGRRNDGDERAAIAAAKELGLRLEQVRRVHPFPQAKERHLYVYVKVSETPSRFPRRPGIARKRPLCTADDSRPPAAADRDGR
jgi:16S rRNA (guanine527-N7)-methyltransferase